MYPPGFYQTNYRALRIRELFRMGGLLRLPLRYLITRFKSPGNPVWMPGLWADGECGSGELSERFWDATGRFRSEFERLGFSECCFSRVTRHLMANHRDSGTIRYLDANRRHFGILVYTRLHAAAPINRDIENIAVAFTAAFGPRRLSYSNNKNAFDPPRNHQVTRLLSAEPAPMYDRFVRDVSRQAEPPRQFPDLDSLRTWFDEGQMEAFQERVRRGLFVRMSEKEIDTARSKMPPPLPGEIPNPRRTRN